MLILTMRANWGGRGITTKERTSRERNTLEQNLSDILAI